VWIFRWGRQSNRGTEELKEKLNYAKAIIKDLLDNSDEYAKQRAIDFLKEKNMIGYKATDMNGCCRGFKFEVGKTYTKDTPADELECCTNKVFHFCRELCAIEKESGYKLSESRLFEVIAGDYVRSGDKYGTNSLTILREITGCEKEELCNSGYGNSGDGNSGSRNSGYGNSGDGNSGNCNSGDGNSGLYNSGDGNSGSWNSGNWNSGSWNSGDGNSGSRNSGDGNSGSWNSGNWNSGYFNTNTPTVRMFNGDTLYHAEDIDFPSFLYFDLTVWVSHDTATEEEKREHKEEIETCGGYLKTLEYKEAFRLAWDKASKEEHKKLLALPNWDNEIFKEISGIDAEAEIKKEK